MSTFVPKPPFDLTEFLSKPGTKRKPRFGRHGMGDFRPQPAPEGEAAPDAAAPPAPKVPKT